MAEEQRDLYYPQVDHYLAVTPEGMWFGLVDDAQVSRWLDEFPEDIVMAMDEEE